MSVNPLQIVEIINEFSPLVLAIATIILAIFTWKLGRESKKLTDATVVLGKNSASLVETTKQLDKTTARIGRLQILPSFVLTNSESYYPEKKARLFRIQNRGHGVAKNVRATATIRSGQISKQVSAEIHDMKDIPIALEGSYYVESVEPSDQIVVEVRYKDESLEDCKPETFSLTYTQQPKIDSEKI